MNATNERLRNAIKSALAARDETTAEFAREAGLERAYLDRLVSGAEGGVPERLLEVLEALDLELTARSKEQEQGTLSEMMQDNARG